MDSSIGKFASSVSNFASQHSGLISGVMGLIGAAQQRKFEQNEAEKQRLWNEEQADKANQFSLEMWNRTNEYNTPMNQRQRLIEAGMNPLYYGLDGSSANGFEATQALGYERASSSGFQNPIQGALSSAAMQAQIDLTNAQKLKVESDTDSQKLDNEFKSRTMEARVEGQRLANDLTKESIGKISDERNSIAANIKKVAAETENEYLRSSLIQAETNVRKMEAKQIVELLPYNKLLIDAQTENQKASASLAFVNAAIQNGLLEKGFVEATIAHLDAEINKLNIDTLNGEQIAGINAFKKGIRTGNWTETVGEQKDSKVWKVVGDVINSVFGTASAISESIAGPLSGFIK